jgi:predicted ATPase
MKKTRWIVVTGPPSSGKTTIINALAEMGHTVCPEVARELIEYARSNGLQKYCFPRDSLALQRMILAITLRREHLLSTEQRVFFDRGTPDSIAYFLFRHFDPTPAIRCSSYRRYQKVFYCEGLPVIRDGLRLENDVIAQQIGLGIIDAYQRLGYDLVNLPPVSVKERVALVLKELSKLE